MVLHSTQLKKKTQIRKLNINKRNWRLRSMVQIRQGETYNAMAAKSPVATAPGDIPDFGYHPGCPAKMRVGTPLCPTTSSGKPTLNEQSSQPLRERERVRWYHRAVQCECKELIIPFSFLKKKKRNPIQFPVFKGLLIIFVRSHWVCREGQPPSKKSNIPTATLF